MPGSCKQELWIGRTNREIGDADVRSLIQNFRPMQTSIDGFINSALLAGSIGVTQRSDVNDICVLRIDDHPADVARVL